MTVASIMKDAKMQPVFASGGEAESPEPHGKRVSNWICKGEPAAYKEPAARTWSGAPDPLKAGEKPSAELLSFQ